MTQAVLQRIMFITLLFVGCEDVINPIAKFEPRLVVYSVLTTQSDTQYVRLYSSYYAPENSPKPASEERPVSDATVEITDGTSTYLFRYATIRRPDTSSNASTIPLYYAYPFRPQENREYTLIVTSPTLGRATANTRIPERGNVNCITINELYGPSRRPILVQFQLSNLTKAQLIRFYLVYTTENPGEGEQERYYEVPVFWRIIDLNYELHEKIYAKPDRRTAPLSRRNQPATMTLTYPFPTYPESHYEIQHYNFNVRFKRAVFYLIQFDEPWYKYYATANLFQDRLAVRLDSPDYSNIEGGFGLFGSLRVDSTVVPLPEYIPPYR